MQIRPIRVLKSDQVLVSGSVCLETGSSLAPVRTSAPSEGDAHSSTEPGHAQQASIVETTDQYVVIEVVCSCGSTTRLQCNHAEMAAAE